MSQIDTQIDELRQAVAGRLELLGELGGGGMANVLLARNKKHGGFVAIKLLAAEFENDSSVVARFCDEARTVATLGGHPNIVTIFDINESNNLHYIEMQYVRGEDLSSVLKRKGRISETDALNVVAQIASALDFAASYGVVHRDLKPSNIRLDEHGRAIVLDFGIAKADRAACGQTLVGQRVGTPWYMAPEQIDGSCDTRTDLYALGCVAFELMTGQRPYFFANDPFFEKVLHAHRHASIPRIYDLNPEVSEPTTVLIAKLMQKDPNARIQSALELLECLQRLGIHPEPGKLRPVPDTVAIQHSARSFEAAALQPAFDVTPMPPLTTDRVEALTPDSDVAVKESGSPPQYRSPRYTRALLATTAVLAISLLVLLAAFEWKPAPPAVISDNFGRMLLVPAGAFTFGENNIPDFPNVRQSKTLDEFYVDESEVSNSAYKEFCDKTGRRYPSSSRDPDSQSFLAHPDLPVANVSFDDAQAFAAWAGKKIPTEEQWERAARGTDGRSYPWGNSPWNDVPTSVQPVRSGEDRKSPVGALNMAGNVAEWTVTVFPATEAHYKDMSALLGTDNFSRDWRVIKGGSFTSAAGNPLPNATTEKTFLTYMRRAFPRDQASSVIGFRCVRDVAPSHSVLMRIIKR